MKPRAPLPISAAAEPAAPTVPIAPIARAAPSAAASPAIVALSEDHTLLQALTLAVIERSAVVTSPSVDRFIDQLVSNSAEVALVDAATAPSPLGAFIMTLRRQFPQLLVVLAGSAPLQSELSALIADGSIFRFAHKPASAKRLGLFVTAALQSAALNRHRASSRTARAAVAPVEQHAAAARTHRTGAARPPWMWPLVLAVTALGALAIGWFASGYVPHRHPLP